MFPSSVVDPIDPQESSLSLNSQQESLNTLVIVDYRYSRFALDPRTGLFNMIRLIFCSLSPGLNLTMDRDWRDPSWTGLQLVQKGIESSVRQQRLSLFGKNEVNIEGKSIISLLVDEVPFPEYNMLYANLIRAGHSSVLCLPNRKHSIMVPG